MRKLLLTATALPLLYGTLFFGFPVHKAHNRIKPFLEANTSKLMREQEKTLGIKYGSVPEFEFVYPITPSGRRSPMEYDNNGEGVVKIAAISVSAKNETGLEELVNKLVLGGDRQLRDGLNHELTHVYLDQRRKEMEKEGKPVLRILTGPKDNDFPVRLAFALKLIEEGIATYVERLMSNDDSPFAFIDKKDYLAEVERLATFTWNWRNVNLDYSYMPGFQLVRPIIDKYGSGELIFYC